MNSQIEPSVLMPDLQSTLDERHITIQRDKEDKARHISYQMLGLIFVYLFIFHLGLIV